MITPPAVSLAPTEEGAAAQSIHRSLWTISYSELTARCYHALIYSLYFGYPICQSEWARFLRGFSSSKVTTKWRNSRIMSAGYRCYENCQSSCRVGSILETQLATKQKRL